MHKKYWGEGGKKDRNFIIHIFPLGAEIEIARLGTHKKSNELSRDSPGSLITQPSCAVLNGQEITQIFFSLLLPSNRVEIRVS